MDKRTLFVLLDPTLQIPREPGIMPLGISDASQLIDIVEHDSGGQGVDSS
jgi:hypothetical protein